MSTGTPTATPLDLDVVRAEHCRRGDRQIARDDAGIAGVDDAARREQIDVAGLAPSVLASVWMPLPVSAGGNSTTGGPF